MAADERSGEKAIPVMLVLESAAPAALRCHLRAAPLRCADLGPRPQDGEILEHALRRGLGGRACGTSSSGCPNGARFVFWRGSSYIPFWAGRHNTGACYEWAEIISQPEGAVDCVEPLMDKELRYSRVEIVESTAARVHVRWSYQSTDFNYKVWGDAAVEDYYFYPDGFGTRVVNLKADPKNDYELSEFIILTPQGGLSLRCLAGRPGRRPVPRRPEACDSGSRTPSARRRDSRDRETAGVPAIYRLRLNKEEELAAVYFNPNETKLPPVVFAPFFDGARWSLRATGGATGRWRGETRPGRTIDDRIHFTPTSQQRDELGRQPADAAPDERPRSPWTPWAGPGR